MINEIKTIIPLAMSLQYETESAAKDLNGRISNWKSAKATTNDVTQGTYTSNNEGRYSRRCTYIKYSYTPLCTSYAILGDFGLDMVAKIDKKTFKIKVPFGYFFDADGYGIKLVNKKNAKMDFHFNTSHIVSSGGRRQMVKSLKENWLLKKNAERKEKAQKKLDKIFTRDLKTTRVTLWDSQCAGNCIEGSIRFAENFLKISREAIVNGKHLLTVAAERLVKSGDSRAHAAAKFAWQRETMVAI
jgi:hypothetical protein